MIKTQKELEKKLGMEIPEEDFELLSHCSTFIDVYTIDDLKTRKFGTFGGGTNNLAFNHPDVIAFLEEKSLGKFILALSDPTHPSVPKDHEIVKAMLIFLNDSPWTLMELIEAANGSLFPEDDQNAKTQFCYFNSN